MDSANVQVLRQLEELFNGRDLDAYLELLDPAVEWHVSPEDPDTTVHHGREEVRAYVEGWIDAFADPQIHTEVVNEAGLFSLRAGRLKKVEDLGRGQASTK